MNRHAFAVLGLALGLSACTATVHQPPAAGPTATLKFEFLGDDPMVGGSAKQAGLSDVPSCKGLRWHFGKEPATVAAGRTLHVVHANAGAYGGGCFVTYSFTPEAGARYVSQFTYGQPQCQVKLQRVQPDGSLVREPSARQDAKPFCENF